MPRRYRIWFVLAALTLAACTPLTQSVNGTPGASRPTPVAGGATEVPATLAAATPSVTPANAGAVVLDQEFTLKIGQAVTVADAGLMLSFGAVLEDSRCPKNVLCVWAGQARIAVRAQQADRAATELELILGPTPKADRAIYGDYQVQLIRLDPYPETPEVAISVEDYQATLLVTRAAPAEAELAAFEARLTEALSARLISLDSRL